MQVYVAVDLPPSARIKFDSFVYAEMGLNELRFMCKASATGHQQTLDHTRRSVPIDYMLKPDQIGLVPANLSLPQPQDAATETALVLRHAERMIDVMKRSSGQWKGHIAGDILANRSGVGRKCSCCL